MATYMGLKTDTTSTPAAISAGVWAGSAATAPMDFILMDFYFLAAYDTAGAKVKSHLYSYDVATDEPDTLLASSEEQEIPHPASSPGWMKSTFTTTVNCVSGTKYYLISENTSTAAQDMLLYVIIDGTANTYSSNDGSAWAPVPGVRGIGYGAILAGRPNMGLRNKRKEKQFWAMKLMGEI